MAARKLPRCSMINPDGYAVRNPSSEGDMVVTVLGEEPVNLHSDAGAMDDVELAMFGTIEFVLLARNNDREYMGIEVFDAETGEKLAEAFTDKPEEIKDIAPGAIREKNPTKASTVMKRMYPYAMGHKAYRPKARKRNAKKKGSSR